MERQVSDMQEKQDEMLKDRDEALDQYALAKAEVSIFTGKLCTY